MTNYDQVVQLLGKLTQEELMSLEKRIKSLRSLSTMATNAVINGAIQQTADNGEDAEFFVLRCASEVMQSLGADPCSTMPMLRRVVGPAFRAKLPGLMAYLRSHAKLRVDRHSILCLGFQLLYRDMTKHGYVVTTRTLLNHLHRIPAIIEVNFPGYLRAGVSNWMRAKTSGVF